MGVNVPLGSTWNNKGVRQAQADLNGFQRQAKGFSSSISKSLLGIGAGIGGAFALSSVVTQMKDMAKTAAEDQASVTKLSVALRNMGLASEQSGVEEFIRNTMLATGVTDDQLRPALARLLRSTGDVEESQRALGRALNISVATGKDLDTVANGLGKAYDGNAASLGRLGLGLDSTLLKSGDVAAIMDELDRKFAGQSAAAAETYTGQMQRLSTAVDEAKESIGYALLGAVGDLGSALGGTDGAVSGITRLGDGIAQIIEQSAGAVGAIQDIYEALRDGTGASEEGSVQQTIWNRTFEAGSNAVKDFVAGPLYALMGAYEYVKGDTNEASTAANRYKLTLQAQADAARDAAGGNEDVAAATGEAERSFRTAAEQAERFQRAVDRVFGRRQSKIEDRIALKRMRQNGPDESGSRTVTVDGKKQKQTFSTADDARMWAVDYARQAAQYASDFSNAAKREQILGNAQAYIAQTVGQYGINRPRAFAASLVGTDPVYASNPRQWENQYLPGASEPGSPVYNFTVTATSGGVLNQITKEAERLAASSGGRFTAPGGRYGANGAR